MMLKNAFRKIMDGNRQFLLDILPKGSIGAEIGVHEGGFSKKILESVSPKTLYLIDPWEHLTGREYRFAWYGGAAKGGQAELNKRYSSICQQFGNYIERDQIKIRRGYSSDMLEQLPDEHLDWVYIDGNHLYEYVKTDLELSLQKVKSGGLITGDDYGSGGWWKGGVKRAVDEFAENPAVELVALRKRQYVFLKK